MRMFFLGVWFVGQWSFAWQSMQRSQRTASALSRRKHWRTMHATRMTVVSVERVIADAIL